MKNILRKTTLALGLVLCTLFASARMVHKQVSVTGYYYPCNMEIYIPDNATTKTPTVFFIPGLGEQNTNVQGLYTWGPMVFINQGWKPDFIIAAIQPSQGWPGGGFVDEMMSAALADPTNLIDKDRITLTGLSAGANCIYDYIRWLPQTPNRIVPTSIITFSFYLSSACGGATPCAGDEAWHYLPAWGLCGTWDSFYGGHKWFWDMMINTKWPNKVWTDMFQYGHGGWNDFYNPTWKQNGVSLYDWAKQFWIKASILPIQFGTFDGQVLSNGTQLNWTTETESNNSHFEIERSTDGVNFTKVGTVPTKAPNGNSATTIKYNFLYTK
jgi:hypothetical protein